MLYFCKCSNSVYLPPSRATIPSHDPGHVLGVKWSSKMLMLVSRLFITYLPWILSGNFTVPRLPTPSRRWNEAFKGFNWFYHNELHVFSLIQHDEMYDLWHVEHKEPNKLKPRWEVSWPTILPLYKLASSNYNCYHPSMVQSVHLLLVMNCFN